MDPTGVDPNRGLLSQNLKPQKPWKNQQSLPPRIAHVFKMTKVILRRDDSQFKLKADEFVIR
jgi:hypothetical protein